MAQEETHDAVSKSAPTTLITTIATGVLVGNVGGIGDSVHNVLAQFFIDHQNWAFGLVGAFIVATRLANALYDTYPSKEDRPRWVQFLISIFPTKMPPKEA